MSSSDAELRVFLKDWAGLGGLAVSVLDRKPWNFGAISPSQT